MAQERVAGLATLSDGRVTVASTSRVSGDFSLGADNLISRYRSLTGGIPVLFPRQVHGREILFEDSDTGRRFGRLSHDEAGAWSGAEPPEADRPEADAVIAVTPGRAISVITADCAPVGIWTDDGVIGVAHAGWRGLLAGVVEAAVRAVCSLSATPHTVRAVLGPCIGPCCYEFGEGELVTVAQEYGETVRSQTASGTLSLDLRAGVIEALKRSGCEFFGHLTASGAPVCTACDSGFFSWRRSADSERQALVMWATAP